MSSLEKIYQQYAVESSSKMGLNSFIRFLKEYSLIDSNSYKNVKKDEYQIYSVSVSRAQIIFKQTTQYKNAKLNFENFLYALKKLSLELFPYSNMERDLTALDVT